MIFGVNTSKGHEIQSTIGLEIKEVLLPNEVGRKVCGPFLFD